MARVQSQQGRWRFLFVDVPAARAPSPSPKLESNPMKVELSSSVSCATIPASTKQMPSNRCRCLGATYGSSCGTMASASDAAAAAATPWRFLGRRLFLRWRWKLTMMLPGCLCAGPVGRAKRKSDTGEEGHTKGKRVAIDTHQGQSTKRTGRRA